MGQHLDPERLTQEGPRDGGGGHPGGGLPGAGALQHRAGVVEAVLQHAGVVGVARPGPGQRGVAGDVEFGGRNRIRGHHGFPLGPLAVADLDGDRAAEGEPVAHTGQHGDLILLELHPRAAAVAQASARQLIRDVARGHLDTGHHALDNGHQGAAVGFTGGRPSQHGSIFPCRGSRTQSGERKPSRGPRPAGWWAGPPEDPHPQQG